MRNVKWLSSETWVCLKHAPSLRLPASQKTCWLCGDERPEVLGVVIDLPIKVEKDKEFLTQSRDIFYCAWEGCRNPPRNKSKYCSRDCSNKNARKRYAERKRVGA